MLRGPSEPTAHLCLRFALDVLVRFFQQLKGMLGNFSIRECGALSSLSSVWLYCGQGEVLLPEVGVRSGWMRERSRIL